MRKIKHSQNFFKNNKVLKNILNRSSINEKDTVLEIGAGTGFITKQLIKHAKQVIAIEKDPKLFKRLQKNLGSQPNLKILNQDIVKLNLYKIIPKTTSQENYKIFSNIPFNYTSDIINIILTTELNFQDIYLYMQKEAILTYLGNPKETLKSLLLKSEYIPSVFYKFALQDFKPQPNVDIYLLRLTPETRFTQSKKLLWRDFTSYAFSQFNPTLEENLADLITNSQFKRLRTKLKYNSNATLTDLDFDQWLGLFSFFNSNYVSEKKKSLIKGSYKALRKKQDRLEKKHKTTS